MVSQVKKTKREHQKQNFGQKLAARSEKLKRL
jgi:hypothetical protein